MGVSSELGNRHISSHGGDRQGPGREIRRLRRLSDYCPGTLRRFLAFHIQRYRPFDDYRGLFKLSMPIFLHVSRVPSWLVSDGCEDIGHIPSPPLFACTCSIRHS